MRTRRSASIWRRGLWRHVTKCGWVMAWASVVVAFVPPMASAFEFYPPFLPDHIAVNESFFDVELRVYLNDSEVGSQVRITPVSEFVQFTPSEVVFTSTQPVAQTLTMLAHDAGSAVIKFVAQVETWANGEWTVFQNATDISVQEIDVLAPPQTFAIDDMRWDGVILLNDSFENDSFSVSSSPLWERISHGYPSSACGALDGSKALYFTALGDRFATTKPLNLLGFNGKLRFQHLYGYRFGQDYDVTGDNRVSCEMVDQGEEMVLSYLPANQAESNASAWRELMEVALPVSTGPTFSSYSVVLPMTAMHSEARFRWQQKSHSSFPVDPISGLSLGAVISGENDNTSVNGNLGIAERELWHYRNLFDQWALDDVRLEVRLNPPIFQNADDKSIQVFQVSANAGYVNVSIGQANVVVDSPVQDTWTEFVVGDGTHAFPVCNIANIAKASTAQAVRMTESGYIHAIACLVVNHNAPIVVSSFPTRSQRILVKARSPLITTVLDTTTAIDTWTVQVTCAGCSFIRYTAYSPSTLPVADVGSDPVTRVTPSCSFGTLTNGSSGTFTLNANSQIFAIACGKALLPSDVVSTNLLHVAPRVPVFAFTYTPTTITNEFEVTMSPPGDGGLGIAYTVGEANAEDPTCPLPEAVSAGDVVITVRASDVIRAVSCCANVQCVDSTVAVWGPIQVQTVAPVYSMACSRMKPRTVVLHVASVTTNAWIQYQIGKPSQNLNCVETNVAPFLLGGDIEVAPESTSVYAVSCLNGLQPSAQVEIPIVVDQCCAGIESFQYPSCAHVLLLHDDFGACLDTSKWTKLTTQWGGEDVNGGVHADNVQCIQDPTHSKNMLQLSAHGDIFAGTTPVGTQRVDDSGSLQLRTIDDMYLEWALDGVSPTPCNDLDRCPARRVGAAITTTPLKENAGVMVIRLKPCKNFGTQTQIWWGDYTQREDETQQEVSFLPLWKAGLYQAKTTSEVSFVLSSPSNLPLPDDDRNDQEFIEVTMQWNATVGRSNLYVNGQLVHKQILASNSTSLSMATAPLSIGVWFPNAVTGEPLFATCDVLVDEVHVFKAEVTGDRWCDFDDVEHDVIPCSTDRDCENWVFHNCFMPIHEAVCVSHRNETLKQPQEIAPRDTNDDTVDEVDVTDSESNDIPQPAPRFFCQFRLEPMTEQVDPTATLHSTTEMTQRVVGLEWLTEEGSSNDRSVPIDAADDSDTS